MSAEERKQVSGIIAIGSSFVPPSGSKKEKTLHTVDKKKQENGGSEKVKKRPINPEPDLVPPEIQQILDKIEEDEKEEKKRREEEDLEELRAMVVEETNVEPEPPQKRKFGFKLFRAGEVNSAYLGNILEKTQAITGDIHPLNFGETDQGFNYLSLTRAGKNIPKTNFDPFNQAQLPDSWFSSAEAIPVPQPGPEKDEGESHDGKEKEGEGQEGAEGKTEEEESLELRVARALERRQALEQYWNIVKENPYDFTGWCHLLEHVETMRDINIIRGVYNAFLPLYPYCFAYWKRYSDMERKNGNDARAVEVLERGLEAIPFSNDLWLSLISLTQEMYNLNTGQEEYTRWRYEQAISTAGFIFTADSLWESYINWESKANRLDKVTALYRRAIKVPTRLYNKHFDNFIAHVRDHHPIDILGQKEYEKRREQACKRIGVTYRETFHFPRDDRDPTQVKRKMDKPESKLIAAMKEKMVADVLAPHKEVQKEVDTVWEFEDKIRRPYFHVKPLDKRQLRNWHDYLDFEIERGNYTKIVTLFERCLVACANYEEFWVKYARFVEKWIGRNPAKEERNKNEEASQDHSAKQKSETGGKENEERGKGKSDKTDGNAKEVNKKSTEKSEGGEEKTDTNVKESESGGESDKGARNKSERIGNENNVGEEDKSVSNGSSSRMDESVSVISRNEEESEVRDQSERQQEEKVNKVEEAKNDVEMKAVDSDSNTAPSVSDVPESSANQGREDDGRCEEQVTNHVSGPNEAEANQKGSEEVTTNPKAAEQPGEDQSSAPQVEEDLEKYEITADSVRNVFRRGCLIHCPKKPRIRLLWSLFEEEQGNVEWARSFIEQVVEQYPSLLEARSQLIELEHRLKNHERVIQLYEYHLPHTWKVSKQMGSWLSVKYARYQFKIMQNPEKALQILRTALKKDKSNPSVYQNLVDLCYQRQPIDAKGVKAAFTLALLSKDLKPSEKVRFAKKKMEFARDFGDIKSYRESMEELSYYQGLEAKAVPEAPEVVTVAAHGKPVEVAKTALCSKCGGAADQAVAPVNINTENGQQIDSGMMQYFQWLQAWYQQFYGEQMSGNAFNPPELPNYGAYGYGETDFSQLPLYQKEQLHQAETSAQPQKPDYSEVPPTESINMSIPLHLKKDPSYQEWEVGKFKKYADLESKGWPKDHTTVIHVTINDPMPVPPQKPLPPRRRRRWFKPRFEPPEFPDNFKLRMIDPKAVAEVQYLDLAGADLIYPSIRGRPREPEEFRPQFFHEQRPQAFFPRGLYKWFNPNNFRRKQSGWERKVEDASNEKSPEGKREELVESTKDRGPRAFFPRDPYKWFNPNCFQRRLSRWERKVEDGSSETSPERNKEEVVESSKDRGDRSGDEKKRNEEKPKEIKVLTSERDPESRRRRRPSGGGSHEDVLRKVQRLENKGRKERPGVGFYPTRKFVPEDGKNRDNRAFRRITSNDGPIGNVTPPLTGGPPFELFQPPRFDGFPPSPMDSFPPPSMGGIPPQSMDAFPPPTMGGFPPQFMDSFPPPSFEGFPPPVPTPLFPAMEQRPVPDAFGLPPSDELAQNVAPLSFMPCVNTPDWLLSNGGQLVISQGPDGFSNLRFTPRFLTDQGIHLVYESLRRSQRWLQRGTNLNAWLGPCAYESKDLFLAPCDNWPVPVCDLIYRLIEDTSHQWNSCLISLFRSGYDWIPWSEEPVPSAGKNPPVALVLLGSMRIVELQRRHGRKDFMRFPMFPGSALILEGATAHNWAWQLPRDPSAVGEQMLLAFHVLYANES